MLFASCRVARGPANPYCLRMRRVTEGIGIDGNKFHFEDDWRVPEMAHKLLDGLWTGHTTFKVRSVVWADAGDEGEL